MNAMHDINRPVIFRTDRIGEVLLSTVAVDAVKKRFPAAEVTFVTSTYSRPLIENRDDVEEVITFDTMASGNDIARALPLAVKLRKRGFDAALVLNPHKSLHLACLLAGIPLRAGYDRKWGFCLNRKMPDERDRGLKHEVLYTFDLLDLIGAGGEPEGPVLPVDTGRLEEVRSLLSAEGMLSGRPVVAVHPGSSNPAKIWPRDKYSALIERVKAETRGNCEICLIGTDKETPISEEIIERSGGLARDMTGRFDLGGLAAFLSLCDVFTGNDTGPMHMAAAVGTPVVAVFGRNVPGAGPVRWGPWGEKNTVFHQTPGCDPCYDGMCPYAYRCMKSISVDAVADAVLRSLRKKR
jgi:lipopolysaccharide heptosyltransferase II